MMKRLVSVFGALSMIVIVSGCARKIDSRALLGAGSGGGKATASTSTGVVDPNAPPAETVGQYMDRLEGELKRKNLPATMERQGDQLLLRFNANLLYGVGKADLMREPQKQLIEVVNVLIAYPRTKVVIEAFTDNSGAVAYNQDLSEKRSISIGEFFIFQGVDDQRLEIFGSGDERPIADNATESGRQQNRRVEIRISPNAELQKASAH